MIITDQLFSAFLKCPTKCWLRRNSEGSIDNTHSEWVSARDEAYRKQSVDRLMARVPVCECVISPAQERLNSDGWRVAIDVAIRNSDLETRIHAVYCDRPTGRGHAIQYVPTRFTLLNKLGPHDKLLLAFDALILGACVGSEVSSGRIIHGDDHATARVRTSALAEKVKDLVAKTLMLLSSASPPDLVLNRHCTECEFQGRCRQKALEKDDLSLLSGMTEKERRKLNAKGIFTVTQLSYTFRPRRRPKRRRSEPEKYQHALRALAIRDRKIYVVGNPELKIDGTPVYLDAEGLPDDDYYYLIGIRIGCGVSAVQHSLWADAVLSERLIWKQFLEILVSVERPILIHYGSYETSFLKRMIERYGGLSDSPTIARALTSAINLLKVTYGQIYFPSFSNGLKGVASSLGFRWTEADAAGAQAIFWRGQWEQGRDPNMKLRLIRYNAEDCAALEVVVSTLIKVLHDSTSRGDVALADRYGSKPTSTERGAELHKSLELVLKSAHAGYRAPRMHFRNTVPDGKSQSIGTPSRSQRTRRSLPTNAWRTIHVPRRRKCPKHPEAPTLLRPTKWVVQHTLLDVVSTKSGIKKVAVRYVGRKAYCPFCDTLHVPPAIKRIGGGRLFGDGISAWVVYLRVALRLSYRLIAIAARDLLHENISPQTSMGLIEHASERYGVTERALLHTILQSPVIHIDETRLNILGTQQYAWVITDGGHVVFRLTAGREAHFLHKLLDGFTGTIVSDFYGAYDALPCRQQKCWAHLIRDLNEDLWKSPFNTDYEDFVATVQDLLTPIFEDAWRFGQKALHLKKHLVRVQRFYRDTINGPTANDELIAKYRKRFVRYRESLFTFLEYNGVPWNNNAAERAIRHLAVQRKISYVFSEAGANHYLRFLAIAQTCRFQGKSFLGFLNSGLKQVDAYQEKRRLRTAANMAT